MSNPVAGLQHLIPEWLFILYAIAAVGGAVANNVVTFYASGSDAAVGRRPAAALPGDDVRHDGGDGARRSTSCSSRPTSSPIVNDFLSLLLIWIGPFAGVWLIDGTLRRWSYDPVDIHAVQAGAAGRYWGWHGHQRQGLHRHAERGRRVRADDRLADSSGTDQQVAERIGSDLAPRSGGRRRSSTTCWRGTTCGPARRCRPTISSRRWP